MEVTIASADVMTVTVSGSSGCTTIVAPASPLDPITIYVDAPSHEYNLQTLSSPDEGTTDGFRATTLGCGDVIFTANLYYFTDSS